MPRSSTPTSTCSISRKVPTMPSAMEKPIAKSSRSAGEAIITTWLMSL